MMRCQADRPVLVTGGAGFVGSHITRALLERGCRVVVADLASEAPEVITQAATSGGRLGFERADVADAEQLAEIFGAHRPSSVIHAAALLGEPESLERPREFFRVNTEAVWSLCEAVRNRQDVGRVVIVGTRAVYGAYHPDEGPVPEEAAPRPLGFYGGSKAMADLSVDLFRRYLDVDVVSARITGPYGWNATYPTPITEMLAAAAGGDAYVLEHGGDHRVELTYVKDLARGVLALLDAPTLAHAVYNIGSGRSYRLAEVVATIRRLVPDARLQVGPGPLAGAAPRARMDVSRATTELGFTPHWNLEEGLADMMTSARTHTYGQPVESVTSP